MAPLVFEKHIRTFLGYYDLARTTDIYLYKHIRYQILYVVETTEFLLHLYFSVRFYLYIFDDDVLYVFHKIICLNAIIEMTKIVSYTIIVAYSQICQFSYAIERWQVCLVLYYVFFSTQFFEDLIEAVDTEELFKTSIVVGLHAIL